MSYDELYHALVGCMDALNWIALGEAVRLNQQITVVCNAYCAAPENPDAQAQLRRTAEAVSRFFRNRKHPNKQPVAYLSNLLVRMQTEAQA